MAIASAGTMVGGGSTSPGTQLSFAPTATLNVGNCAILAIAFDNTGTAHGLTSEITSINDDVGNVYSFLAAVRNGEGAAAAC